MPRTMIPGHGDWKRIEHGFRTKWIFPDCVGVMDGKHINILAPDDTSDYYNYKGTHSIILLALVDDDYCFSYVNVGTNGRASDGAACSLHNWLRKTSGMYITQRCIDFEDIQQRVVVPGSWRAQLQRTLEGLPPTRYSNHASRLPKAIRDTYAQLFETTEAVPWQCHMI
ncbi:Uncharacterized protein OBRU01_20376 [Operophtera brumata]|uniref:DDE Tnp4 domain-containing protein n=1 Tax=Operophtera brumata TaxID=104452 RepID=A0A0L7KVK1_OPEBR|nr:Uncharacterized protein OBRU01_20376 [Operophtera brumata]